MAEKTPRSVALTSAAILTAVLAITYFLLVYFLEREFEFLWLTLFVVLCFVISYFTIAYFIERFVYRKVKIIYKTIHNFKSQSEGLSRIKMGNDVLGQVNTEVLDWAEQKIKEVKTLKDTENFRKEFIGNLAHELKTPIFNIQGYIETLLDGDLLDADLNRKFLLKAANNVDRITNLLKDLDEITRIESGDMPIALARFDVSELCGHVMDSLELAARSRNIHVYLKQSADKPIFVEADQGRIEQVFVNLISNSIAYGRENGETKIRFYDMDDNILIEVADNGIGIGQEHLPRIFERFYRVDKSRSRNEGGSGLGLAICKHIMESHRQTITVRSTEGVGSTFGFTLKKA